MILEGIYLDPKGKVVFDYANDNDFDAIKTQFGKGKSNQPYVKKYKDSGIDVYSVYNFKIPQEAISVIKKIKSKDVDPKDYENFIKRTVIYLYNILKSESVDMVLIPMSSSPFLNDISKFFKMKFGNYFEFYDSITKNNLENIWIESENDWVSQKANKELERAKKKGDFQLKGVYKQVALSFRDFLKMSDIIEKKVQDKNIVILDDVLASGATMFEIIRLVNKYKPKSVKGVTFFKS